MVELFQSTFLTFGNWALSKKSESQKTKRYSVWRNSPPLLFTHKIDYESAQKWWKCR